jgi:hypothetical protein
VPFLRLTRDRRGFENTFLLHADRPGDRARLLYWYRTAPGIVLGRSPLDEDAIRTIEEQHPDIDFDWPAILALSEVMTPEDEAPAPRQQQQQRQQQQRQGKRREPRDGPREPRRDERVAEPAAPLDEPEAAAAAEALDEISAIEAIDADSEPIAPVSVHGLLEELVGREISTRLRARYSEIMARIHEQDADGATRDAWLKQAAPLNPDLWLTPDAILEGVRTADNLFERLRMSLLAPPKP